MTNTETLVCDENTLSKATAVEEIFTWLDRDGVDSDGLLAEIVELVNDGLPEGVTWHPRSAEIRANEEFAGDIDADELPDLFEELFSDAVDVVRSDLEARTNSNGYRWAA